jgi:hypothetical protein
LPENRSSRSIHFRLDADFDDLIYTGFRMKAPRNFLLLALLLLATSFTLAQPNEAAVSRIKREPVVSTNVASVGYSRRLHALEIEFVRGAVYRFLDVPQKLYRQLLASDSKGHFIAENLRGKYDFIRVRPRQMEAARTHPSQRKTAGLSP